MLLCRLNQQCDHEISQGSQSHENSQFDWTETARAMPPGLLLISAVKTLLGDKCKLTGSTGLAGYNIEDAPYTLPHSFQLVIIIMQTYKEQHCNAYNFAFLESITLLRMKCLCSDSAH